MSDEKLALFAHLLRRAGFGASRQELETHVDKEYDELVDELVHPERFPDVETDTLERYFPHQMDCDNMQGWIYRMINTRRPLQEKMAFFWHHVFATGWFKSEHAPTMKTQIEMFRRNGLGKLKDILLDLSRDPAMLYWLDNRENHKGSINENYGRELLELFSMGLGNYTEDDIKNAARAFTGWTFRQPVPLYPYGGFPSAFVYRPEDHDDGEKTFLGETGKLNGEDIIDIIVKQPATARFISRHICNFFLADEAQVPAWSIEEPRFPEIIEQLVNAYFESDGDIRVVMRTLFTSEQFKQTRFQRVKSPAEFVAGTIKLSGEHRFPEPGAEQLESASLVMGQHLMNPPTVEGWHTGKEWIDGGTLNERVNFAVEHVNDPEKPGVRWIVERLEASGDSMIPTEFVERCLELAGPIEAGEETRSALLSLVEPGGDVRFDTDENRNDSARRVSHMLRLIVASREYQFA